MTFELVNKPAEKVGAGGTARKANAQKTVLSGTLGDPIFTARVAGSAKDQALVEAMYDAADKAGRGASVRGKVVEPKSPSAQAKRAAELAARFGKRVVWVEGLGTDGVAYGPTIFLDPDSGRHTQVLVAHELAHTLASSNRAAFGKLIDSIRPLIDVTGWGKFVVGEHEQADLNKQARLTPEELREELVVKLMSDFAYRATTDNVRGMDSSRRVAFIGYGAYPAPATRASVQQPVAKCATSHTRRRRPHRRMLFQSLMRRR